MSAPLGSEDATRLERCVAGGGVAILPTDTVYGVCCDPEDDVAAARLYGLKGRPAERPAAVMFFSIEPALAALGAIEPALELALRALLPGPVTVLLANRAERFGAACGADPATLGLRVPRLPPALAALAQVDGGVLQTSANLTGGPDPRAVGEIPATLRAGVDLVLDGGDLPGTPSTVVDLRDYALSRVWRILREGALSRTSLEQLLQSLA